MTRRTMSGITRAGKARGCGQVKGMRWEDMDAAIAASLNDDPSPRGHRDPALLPMMLDALLRVSGAAPSPGATWSTFPTRASDSPSPQQDGPGRQGRQTLRPATHRGPSRRLGVRVLPVRPGADSGLSPRRFGHLPPDEPQRRHSSPFSRSRIHRGALKRGARRPWSASGILHLRSERIGGLHATWKHFLAVPGPQFHPVQGTNDGRRDASGPITPPRRLPPMKQVFPDM